jgi:thiosulfate reductase cytochrome b subunit
MYILSAFVIVYGIFIGTTKKPFNPLLGETYEYFDQEYNTKVICEQVSHHPPISAFYIENNDFIYTGWIQVKILLNITGVKVLMDSQSILTLKST